MHGILDLPFFRRNYVRVSGFVLECFILKAVNR